MPLHKKRDFLKQNEAAELADEVKLLTLVSTKSMTFLWTSQKSIWL